MDLKNIKIEPLWRNDEARQQFDALEKIRDEIAISYGVDTSALPREKLDIEVSSATELARRERRHWTPERIAQATTDYQRAIEPITKTMVELFARFTTPQITVFADQPQEKK